MEGKILSDEVKAEKMLGEQIKRTFHYLTQVMAASGPHLRVVRMRKILTEKPLRGEPVNGHEEERGLGTATVQLPDVLIQSLRRSEAAEDVAVFVVAVPGGAARAVKKKFQQMEAKASQVIVRPS